MHKTFDLKRVFEKIVPELQSNKFFARVFQAIRIEVNDEINSLKDLLQQAETEMSQSIQLAERGYGKKHTITAEHCEYNSMFQGGIRHDFNGAEILALKAADCREGHLKDLLAEEEFAKQNI